MIFTRKSLTAALVMFMSCGFAHAQNTQSEEVPETEGQSLKAAQDQLGASFKDMTISGFSESPIKGIYQFRTGSNLIYFYPGKDEKEGVLIFGEMFTPSGISLTEQSKMEGMKDVLKTLPLESAISIGPKDAPVFYEFTDPDCPYCHAYDEWITAYSKDHPVQRKLIFFSNPSHPLADAKMKHIICSDDKEAAYRYVFSGQLPHNPDSADAVQLAKQQALKTCKEADQVLSKHSEIIRSVGVNGTPSFLFNIDTTPKLIVGFSQQKIATAITALEKDQKPKVSKPSDKTTK